MRNEGDVFCGAYISFRLWYPKDLVHNGLLNTTDHKKNQTTLNLSAIIPIVIYTYLHINILIMPGYISA